MYTESLHDWTYVVLLELAAWRMYLLRHSLSFFPLFFRDRVFLKLWSLSWNWLCRPEIQLLLPSECQDEKRVPPLPGSGILFQNEDLSNKGSCSYHHALMESCYEGTFPIFPVQTKQAFIFISGSSLTITAVSPIPFPIK